MRPAAMAFTRFTTPRSSGGSRRRSPIWKRARRIMSPPEKSPGEHRHQRGEDEQGLEVEPPGDEARAPRTWPVMYRGPRAGARGRAPPRGARSRSGPRWGTGRAGARSGSGGRAPSGSPGSGSGRRSCPCRPSGRWGRRSRSPRSPTAATPAPSRRRRSQSTSDDRDEQRPPRPTPSAADPAATAAGRASDASGIPDQAAAPRASGAHDQRRERARSPRRPPPGPPWARAWPAATRGPAAASGVRGFPRKTVPCTFTKQAVASAPTSASTGAMSTAKEARSSRGSVEGRERPERHEPLGDEAVQRREPADGRRAHEEEARRPGHGAGQAAQSLDVAGAGGVLHRARRPRKSSDLKSAWFTTWRAPPAKPSRTSPGSPRARPRSASPSAHGDDADVLHRVVGEQPLEIVLGERQRHAQHARDARPGRAA